MGFFEDLLDVFADADPKMELKKKVISNHRHENIDSMDWVKEANRIRAKIAVVEGEDWAAMDKHRSYNYERHSTYVVLVEWAKKGGRGGVIYGYQNLSRYSINSKGQVVFMVDHNPDVAAAAEAAGFILE